MTVPLETAVQYCTVFHAGQKDKSGEPYFLHPLRAMLWVREAGGTEDQQCAAALHDTVEDTTLTLGTIRFQFGPVVAEIVDALTRRDSDVGKMPHHDYDAYIERVLACPKAVLVKLADVTDNLRRMGTLHQHDPVEADRLKKRYLDTEMWLRVALEKVPGLAS